MDKAYNAGAVSSDWAPGSAKLKLAFNKYSKKEHINDNRVVTRIHK